MLLRRLVNLCALLAFLVTGGLSGYARVDLCLDGSECVQLETPFACCCGADDRTADEAQQSATAARPVDCEACSGVPLATGQATVASSRDLRGNQTSPPAVAPPIPAILLPFEPRHASAASASGAPASAARHESVAITVLRC